jgi:hypothetical protein
VSARVPSWTALDRVVLAGALAAIALLAGCRKKEGIALECECVFLTDYDDTSKMEVHVCAESEHEATTVAMGCAQLAAPAPVQGCTCARRKEAPVCRQGCLDRPASDEHAGELHEPHR